MRHLFHFRIIRKILLRRIHTLKVSFFSLVLLAVLVLMIATMHSPTDTGSQWPSDEALTYRRFHVEEENGRVVTVTPIPFTKPPLWARDVAQDEWDWTAAIKNPKTPYFEGPIPFVIAPPEDADEPFYQHNHQPSIAWLNNGDLLAIWYSTARESGTEMTVLASRFHASAQTWDTSSEFFKAENRNMTGSSLFHDGEGTIYHFNGMGPYGGTGWANLALLMRTSRNNGVTWTPPHAIGPEIKGRHQVISGTLMTNDSVLIQPCDAVPSGQGGTAIHISRDGGLTWIDPGVGKPKPTFAEGGVGQGTIAGIHAGVVELNDVRLMALGRGNNINGYMPTSVSDDGGESWTYSASPFPPIDGGQRLVLMRLREGPILFVSFTSNNRRNPRSRGLSFTDEGGNEFTGYGMFAALSQDDGETWPIRKLITPGEGEYDGGAWTGQFTTSPDNAEHSGYLAATQAPDNVIHLISSRLHYRFNLAWLQQPNEGPHGNE
ncbi:hypothetical protein ES708_11838 [subsurface metagenome]